MTISTTILAMALLATGGGQGDAAYHGDDIQLVCFGEAQKTTLESHSGYQWDADKHKYVQKSELQTGKTSFDTAVNVSIHDDMGSIRLPQSLVPPIHGDSNNGWWQIDDLIVGHNEIRGKFRLNGMNKPTISINRVSGLITIDGMIKFTGRCDADDGHRRF